MTASKLLSTLTLEEQVEWARTWNNACGPPVTLSEIPKARNRDGVPFWKALKEKS